MLNPAKCMALLAYYTKGEYKKESRLLLQAIDAGVQKEIVTTAELELCKQQQIKVLREEHFLSAEAAADIVDTLALVLKEEQESGTSQGVLCANCGKELQKEWGVCPYCGTAVKTQQNLPKAEAPPLPSPVPAAQTTQTAYPLPVTPEKKKHTVRNIVLAIAGIILIIVIISVLSKQASNSGQTATPAVESSNSKPAPPAETAIPANFVRVEGGTFQMGTVSGGYDDERPVHTVTVKSFYIGKYEVTQKEWYEVMGNNPSYFKGDNLPVENVSWFDAVKYCNELSQREGLTPVYSGSGDNITCNWNANGYRLPTEAEWEYAAKGGNGSPGNYTYSGSNNIDDVAWYDGNSGDRTQAVGTKAANSLGIHDMSGNVWEWCWDRYGYYLSGSQNDPRGAGSGTDRVARGGGWSNSAAGTRSAYRFSYYPSNRNYYYGGFRLVRP
jgi:formylglycine-generating enzyme